MYCFLKVIWNSHVIFICVCARFSAWLFHKYKRLKCGQDFKYFKHWLAIKALHPVGAAPGGFLVSSFQGLQKSRKAQESG
jgi:hypothetical protein